MKNALLFSYLSLFSTFAFAQNTVPDTRETGTLDEQYNDLVRKGGNYNAEGIRYEVIRISDLEKFRSSVADSIEIANKALIELRSSLAENATEIDALKSKLSETAENLTLLAEKKDSMSFFGAQVSKAMYSGIVWGTIIALAFALVFAFYKFRESNYLTVQAKSALTNLEEEYEQHRRRALEREQKISRELHDERNKNRKRA